MNALLPRSESPRPLSGDLGAREQSECISYTFRLAQTGKFMLRILKFGQF